MRIPMARCTVPCEYVAPPPFESAGYAAWMVWGALPLICPVSLLSPLGGFYSCFMTGDNGSSDALLWGLRRRWWDVKPFQGGLVRRPSPPVGWDHLANVGWEALRSFSGYCIWHSAGC